MNNPSFFLLWIHRAFPQQICITRFFILFLEVRRQSFVSLDFNPGDKWIASRELLDDWSTSRWWWRAASFFTVSGNNPKVPRDLRPVDKKQDNCLPLLGHIENREKIWYRVGTSLRKCDIERIDCVSFHITKTSRSENPVHTSAIAHWKSQV